MDTNTLFMQVASKYFFIALAIEVVLALIYAILNRKRIREKSFWHNGGAFLYSINAFVFFGSFLFMLLKPAEIQEKVINKEPEVITQINIIEKENIIDVPSIMLPLEPEGEQAVIIDSTSIEMEEFMKGFYGENVNFFNNRQNATYLAKNGEITNYSGLDIDEIQYNKTDITTTIQLDDMGYQTVWVFSDLAHSEIVSSKTKVMLYVPRQLTEEKIQDLKQMNRDITIIAIDEIC